MIEELHPGVDVFMNTFPEKSEVWRNCKPYSMHQNSNSSKIISNSKKYVPIFSISNNYLNDIHRNNTWAYRNYTYSNNVKPYLERRKISLPDPDSVSPLIMQIFYRAAVQMWDKATEGVTRRMRVYHWSREINHEILDKLSDDQLKLMLSYFVRKERRKVEKWIISKDLDVPQAYDGAIDQHGNVWKWDQILNFWRNFNGFAVKRPRGTTPSYVIANNYIAKYTRQTGDTEPLACLMIERKYIPYYKAALLVGDFIDPKYLQLWVKEGFDHKDTLHKTMRPKYRKFIKKPLEAAGVEIKEFKNLEQEMFAFYSLPKMKSISDYEAFLKKASDEVLDAIPSYY